jgi:DNA-binding response OmpR family regulator
MPVAHPRRKALMGLDLTPSLAGAKVLVVDDDPATRALIRDLLERNGAVIEEALDGIEALRRFRERRPDVVVLDVGLPRRDGWWTLERLREAGDVPVLMLTTYAGELERVRGLNAGADDYIAKPFGRQELVARLNAVLRRAERRPIEERLIYRDDYLTLDHAQGTVAVRGRDVRLTPLEFALLAAFASRPNIVLRHDQLRHAVWRGTRGVSMEEVKIYVGYLRRKLEPDDPKGTPIETVRGFGYRYRTGLDG